MNRLKKLAFGKTLYHGTNYEGLLGIMQMGGIYPNESSGAGSAGADDKLYDGFTFFATTINKAKFYASGLPFTNGPKVVLEVNLSESALQPDDNDTPGARTWQESNTENSQIKILGPVTTNYIDKVYLYNPMTMRHVATTTLDKVQQVYEEKKDLFTTRENILSDEENLITKKKSKMAPFFKELEDAGYMINSTGLITNQNISNYIDICTKYEAPIFSNDGSIENGNVNIEIKYMTSEDSKGIIIDYDGEFKELKIYTIDIADFIDYCNIYPTTMNMLSLVFGNDFLCNFGGKKISYSDLSQQFYTKQSDDQQIANRLKKRVVY